MVYAGELKEWIIDRVVGLVTGECRWGKPSVFQIIPVRLNRQLDENPRKDRATEGW
jgi:hypothetical protein